MARFDAQVSERISAYKERLDAVLKLSSQEVIADAQVPVARGGRMPVVTGFLRNSLVSGIASETSLVGADSYVLAIATVEYGDSIFADWTAEYAGSVEFGANGRTPRFFVRGAAQKWQSIVAANAAKVLT